MVGGVEQTKPKKKNESKNTTSAVRVVKMLKERHKGEKITINK